MYIRDLDYEHNDFNKEVQDEPKWIESFYWEMMIYDKETEDFKEVDQEQFFNLFIGDPLKHLS